MSKKTSKAKKSKGDPQKKELERSLKNAHKSVSEHYKLFDKKRREFIKDAILQFTEQLHEAFDDFEKSVFYPLGDAYSDLSKAEKELEDYNRGVVTPSFDDGLP